MSILNYEQLIMLQSMAPSREFPVFSKFSLANIEPLLVQRDAREYVGRKGEPSFPTELSILVSSFGHSDQFQLLITAE